MGIKVGIGSLKIGSSRQESLESPWWTTHLFGEDDLLARYRSRDGLSLIDDKGNNASILLPSFNNVNQTTHKIYYTDNQALDIGTSDFTFAIWLEDLSVADAQRNCFGKGTDGTTPAGAWRITTLSNGLLCGQVKSSGGAVTISTGAKARTYGKCFALCEVDQTASVVRFFLNNVQVGVDTSFTGTFTNLDNKYDTCVGMDNNAAGSDYVNKFTGRLADAYVFKRLLTPAEKTALYNRSTVTGAAVHYCLGTGGFMYDYSGNGLHGTTSGTTQIDYSSIGSRQGFNQGYDLWIQDGAYGRAYITHTDSGGSTVATLTGYTLLRSQAAHATKHNGTRSKIVFTQSFFDRSDGVIYKAPATSTTGHSIYTFYDSTNTKLFDIEELTNDCFLSYYEAGYVTKIFSKGNNNPYDTNKYLDELIIYNTAKTGDDLKKVRCYCNLPYRAAGVCITFDDTARIATWLTADYKWRFKYQWIFTGALNLSSDAVATANKTNIDKLLLSNHDFGNHSVNHAQGDDYITANGELAYYTNEFLPCDVTMLNILNIENRVFMHAYMNGSYATLASLILADHDVVRYANTDYPSGIAKYYDGSSQIVYSNNPEYNFSDHSVLLAFLEYAKNHNLVIIINAHSIGDVEADTTIGYTFMEEIMNYMSQNKLKYYRLKELLPAIFE